MPYAICLLPDVCGGLYFEVLLSSAAVTARAPGSSTPRGTASAVCSATFVKLSSGTTTIRAAAAAAEPRAPAKSTAGGVLRATPARGSSAGAVSMAVATRGRRESLEASKTPIRSFSSANFSRGAAEESVKPAFSNRLSRPSWAVCKTWEKERVG
jgi:hypothetical protein